MNYSRWKLAGAHGVTERRVEPPEVEAEREQIRLLMALGQAVHDRRVTMALPEDELADRLGVTVDEVEGVELGDPDTFRPTSLDLLARALEARVDLRVVPGGEAG
ncbi:transcriptional regulator [Streptomyces sp. NPDC127098]|uniref:transcriptional regulator n=1 Tax=Streptomyces sp. NPDC127098 TaxID=3347137 RepID=UPI003661D2F9